MPKYKANVDLWLSHECRQVRAGEEFETEFPKGPDGQPMRLGENLTLVEEEKASAGGRRKAPAAEQVVSKGGTEDLV